MCTCEHTHLSLPHDASHDKYYHCISWIKQTFSNEAASSLFRDSTTHVANSKPLSVVLPRLGKPFLGCFLIWVLRSRATFSTQNACSDWEFGGGHSWGREGQECTALTGASSSMYPRDIKYPGTENCGARGRDCFFK